LLSGLDGVKASHQFLPALGLLSWWFLSRQGQSPFLGEHIAAIYHRGIAADEAPGGRTRVEEFVVPDPRPVLCISTTSPPTGQIQPSGTSRAASDVSPLKHPHRRCCAAPRHRRDDTTVMRSALTPIDLYGIASAHAICPSKPSVLAMSR
jgi:hypothetical protein